MGDGCLQSGPWGAKKEAAMKQCAQCHGKLGLGVRSRNLWNGRWWVHVLYCSTHCEALHELERHNVRAKWLAAHHSSQQSTETTERDLDRNAYHVELDGNRLTWVTREGDKHVRYNSEPHASLWNRIQAQVLSWLPIEGLL